MLLLFDVENSNTSSNFFYWMNYYFNEISEPSQNEFNILAASISEEEEELTVAVPDKFGNAALDFAIALYFFMLFCVIFAIIAKLHGLCIKADNIRMLIHHIFFMLLYGIYYGCYDYI